MNIVNDILTLTYANHNLNFGDANGIAENGPADASLTILLAHGSGAGMDTPFMNAIAEGLGALGWKVVRFVPYMVKSRERGKKSPPNPLGEIARVFSRSNKDLFGSRCYRW